jgi:hypothetical protein
MSFKATLKIGSKEFDVISCSYALHREVDVKGRPASVVYGGTINISVESTDDTSVIETMVNNQHKTLDGTITWKKSDEDAKLKELSFEKGYIVNYAESFSTGGGDAMMSSFTISAQKLKIGSAEHVNDWPGAK